MLYQWLLCVLAILTTSVLPTASRPRTERLSRGPAWTDFRSLVIDPKVKFVAEESSRQFRRVAVVELDVGNQPAVQMFVEIVRTGLMYGNGIIVLDGPTSDDIFKSAQDIASIQSTAKAAKIDIVIIAKMDPETKNVTLEIQPRGEQINLDFAPIQLADLDKAVINAAVQTRKPLLQKLAALPTAHAEQLDRLPQASPSAIRQYIKAKQTLASVVDIKDKQQRQKLCNETLVTINQALEASPNYLEAYILKASCQDELDQALEVKQSLSTAFQKIDSSCHDRLTILELKGDYERFYRKNPVAALEAYQELLDTNPSNLTGLWAMIDILLGGIESEPPDAATLASAAELAAKLVAFHPQSSIAKAILAESNE